jgi:hypothetical protein
MGDETANAHQGRIAAGNTVEDIAGTARLSHVTALLPTSHGCVVFGLLSFDTERLYACHRDHPAILARLIVRSSLQLWRATTNSSPIATTMNHTGTNITASAIGYGNITDS